MAQETAEPAAADRAGAEQATGVSIYHPGGDPDGFAAWSAELTRSAANAPGFLGSRAAFADSDVLDPATAVIFADEAHLHRWLDSPDRARLLADGRSRGVFRRSPDLVLTDGSDLPTGVVVFRHTVADGRESDFVTAEADLFRLSATFPGYEGATLLRPVRPGDQWLSILRFRTDRQLQAWLASDERRKALPQLRSHLTEDFEVITRSTPFGSIMRVQDGKTRVTPSWKTAMLVLLALYPTVMSLSRFLGPVLDELGAGPWLAMWLSQIVSVGLLTWVLMPAVTRWFRRWLDPVDGAGVRVSLIGAGVIVIGYALTLTLFASVQWLQFWDYLD